MAGKGKATKGGNKQLIQVRVTPEVADRIRQVMNEAGSSNMTELFKNAILTYETVRSAQNKGSSIVIKRGNTQERLIVP